MKKQIKELIEILWLFIGLTLIALIQEIKQKITGKDVPKTNKKPNKQKILMA